MWQRAFAHAKSDQVGAIVGKIVFESVLGNNQVLVSLHFRMLLVFR